MTALEAETFRSFTVPGGLHGIKRGTEMYKVSDIGIEEHAKRSQIVDGLWNYVTVCIGRRKTLIGKNIGVQYVKV